MKDKKMIVILLIIAAVAFWAFTSGKINLEGTEFFAGSEPEGGTTLTEEVLDVSCEVTQDCVDALVAEGAHPGVPVRCEEMKCVIQIEVTLPGEAK